MTRKRKDFAGGRTSKGTFAPGVSGRTLALAKREDVGLPEVKQIRNDGWSNFFTGQGIFGKDKRYGASFKADVLTFDEMLELARGDDLAKRAGETLPKEAFRQGWDLVITEDKDQNSPKSKKPGFPQAQTPEEKFDALLKKGTQGDPDDADERVAQIMDVLDKLGAKGYIKQALMWERIFGGGAILMGVNDGQGDLRKPLNLDKVKSLDWLTPLEPRELMPVYGYADPKAPKYGQPEIYRMVSRAVLPSANGFSPAQMLEIHESRLLIFPGSRVSRYQVTSMQGGWGDSILVPMWRVLRDFNMTWASAGALVADYASAVYKFKDLWETLAGDDAEEFQRRLASMELSRSTINATVIDSEDEFERTSTSVAGLADLLDKFATRLAAAAEMPLTLLFGTSPGGLNATGESDIRFFYDRVAEYQEERILPNLKKLIQIIMRTTGSKTEPKKWDITFRPLWQESAKDKASAMLTQAQADAAWIGAGVLSAEEVAAAHWQSGKYNPDITVDFNARERQEQAVAGPVKQEDLDAINPDSPNYKGSQLDPNSTHYIEPPPGSALAGQAKPGGNPFASKGKMDWSPDQARDEHGRWAAEGAETAGALAESAKANGGFTFNPRSGESPGAGYSVAIHGDREKKLVGKDAITPKAIADYIKDNHDVLLRDPQAHLGGWYNPSDDTWYLDVPHVEKDLSVAAQLGHDNKQLGIYDLKRGETINAEEYPNAIAKTGRFTGRTDSARTRFAHQPANANTGGDRRSHEGSPEANPGRAWSHGRLRTDHIVKRGNKFVVLSEDRTKTLGEYGSEAEAQKRLAQVEYFKKDFDESEPRDANGQWTSGGGGGGTAASSKSTAPSSSWKGAAEGHKSTLEAYKHETKWEPHRQQMHEAFARQVTAGVAQCAPGEHTVWMTGGGPASGKTSGLLMNPGAAIPGAGKAVFISADDAKEKIPEYQAGLKAKDPNAAGFVHEESSAMSQLAFNRAMEANQNIVYDSTADSGIDKITKSVQDMRNQGANKVIANYATVDIDEALRRAKSRGERTGRFVPTDVLVANHQAVSKTMLDAMDKGIFDSEKIWDTSGKTPVLVASYDRVDGKVIHDQDAYARLLKRAGRAA